MPRRRQPNSYWINVDLFLTQRDSLSAFIVWLLLEGLSLTWVSSFQLLPDRNRYLSWLLLSVPLGVIGAVLIGLSSTWLKYCHQHLSRRSPRKKLFQGVGLTASWLGLAGIGFPLIMIVIEFWLLITKGFRTYALTKCI